MSDRRYLGEDWNGVHRELIFHSDGSFAIRQWEDVETVIEANKRAYNDPGKGYTPSKDLRRIASFPPTVVLNIMDKYGADPFAQGNQDLLDRVLDDPDYQYLRTAPGTVTRRRLYRSPTVFKEVDVPVPMVVV